MSDYLPEGFLLNSPENRNAMSGIASLKEAMLRKTVLEARVKLCDREHNLHTDLGGITGIIPAYDGVAGENVRDIALISRVGKPVCFTVKAIKRDENGKAQAVLSRKEAQEKCIKEYISFLSPGDIINATVSHIDSFGVFCDIGCGISALLPVDSISVSRIPHPSARFFAGQNIKAIVKSIDENNRVTLTHKELLGTWEENASRFKAGETVSGIIRSVENYGVFVELAPNLAGLAEYNPDVSAGESAAVFIKSIIPERMKIKLVIVSTTGEKPQNPYDTEYFFTGKHINRFTYSPAQSNRLVESVFEA